MRPPSAKSDRAFSFRGGVGINGTILTCDASGSASDLVFLSHAQALGEPGKGARQALRRAGRHDLLATDGTLTLLGRDGVRLRPHALPAPFGRPFTLGDLRLELFPSGHLPGAASLLCEVDDRRVLYAGTVRAQDAGFGAVPGEIRRSDALCLDATFGSPRFVFPPREEALGQVRRFVEQAIASARTPVLLVSPFGTAMEVSQWLHAEGLDLRGHRSIVGAATTFRAAGATPPVIARFAGKVAPREILLWPPEAREAPLLGAIAAPVFAFVSGFSLVPETLAAMRVDSGIALSNQSGFSDLLAYVEATGAKEVALYRGFNEELAGVLRARGYQAYPLGPPRQMELFRG